MDSSSEDGLFSIGIDLGTTNTCCYVQQGDKTIPLPIEGGSYLLPSFVDYKNGKTVVGRVARKAFVEVYSDMVVCNSKRVIGKKYDDPFVQMHLKDCGIPISNDGNNNPVFYVGEKKITPQMVATDILKTVLKRVEDLYHKKPSRVCLTIPARFGMSERVATKQAAINAGIPEEKLVLLNEPTAAAYCYGLDNALTDGTILVYDLGGGTFDLSILKVQNSHTFEVICHEGNSEFGGWDCDDLILTWLEKKVQEKCNRPIIPEDIPENIVRRYRQNLLPTVESAKKELLELFETTIEGEFFDISMLCDDDDDSSSSSGSDDENMYSITITQKDLYEILEPSITATTDKILSTLQQRNMTTDTIDRVVLVGGSTRLRIVEEKLIDLFDQDKLRYGVKADECVAKGACLYAMQSFTALEVTSKSLGMKIANNRVCCIIPVQSRIPLEVPVPGFKTSRDNMSIIETTIIQNYQEKCRETQPFDETCKTIHAFSWSGFAIRPKGEVTFTVTFKLTLENILRITVIENETGKVLLNDEEVRIESI